MARTTALSAALVAAVAGFSLSCGGAATHGDGGAAGTEGSTVSTLESVDLEWLAEWDVALERARAQNRPVLVNFEADWCVWCRKLETTTYRDARVVRFLSERFVPVNMDVEGNGRTLSDRLDVEGLPTIVVLAPSGEELGRVAGYQPPERFIQVVSRLIEG